MRPMRGDVPAVMDPECVFCGIVAGDVPADVVWFDENAVAFLDRSPAAEGHVLVVPRRHTRTLLDASPAEAAAVMAAASQVARLLSATLGPAGFTLFQANETAGWQDVFHLHVHVVPRWPDDALVRPWSAAPADPATLSAVADRIRAPLAAPEQPWKAED
ncbi:MAG: HIT family protein [Acidothermaceae bacterium]